MNKRQRKKKILNGLSTEERYRRTYCPVCKEKIGVFDEYFNTTRRRLDDERTLEKIKGLLGDGFEVEFHLTYGKNILTGEKFIANKQIHITW